MNETPKVEMVLANGERATIALTVDRDGDVNVMVNGMYRFVFKTNGSVAHITGGSCPFSSREADGDFNEFFKV